MSYNGGGEGAWEIGKLRNGRRGRCMAGDDGA